jgi:hypothetical protein
MCEFEAEENRDLRSGHPFFNAVDQLAEQRRYIDGEEPHPQTDDHPGTSESEYHANRYLASFPPEEPW